MDGECGCLTDGDGVYPEVGMDTRDDIPRETDELWDPDAQRRALLAMTMSERLELVAALFKQADAIRTMLPRHGL